MQLQKKPTVYNKEKKSVYLCSGSKAELRKTKRENKSVKGDGLVDWPCFLQGLDYVPHQLHFIGTSRDSEGVASPKPL